MNKVLDFLANNPVGTALKVALGAVLVWGLDNLASFDLPPVVAVFVTAFTPALINYLNPGDGRYGIGSGSAGAGDVAE